MHTSIQGGDISKNKDLEISTMDVEEQLENISRERN